LNAPSADASRTPDDQEIGWRLILALLVIGAGIWLVFREPEKDEWWLEAADEYSTEASMPTSVQKPLPEGRMPLAGGEVTLALSTSIATFNPYTGRQSADGRTIWNLLFPRLAIENADHFRGPSTFRPYLASEWKVASDLKSIEFVLRDAKWSDGTPVTSEDVRFSWLAAKDPAVGWRNVSIVDHIVDIVPTTERVFTVQFKIASHYNLMDICDVNILPKHVFGAIPFANWQANGDWLTEGGTSAGPWVLETFKKGQLITVKRNPNAWEGVEPILDRVHFRVIKGFSPVLAALLSEEIDCMRKVTYDRLPTIRETGRISLFSFQSRSYGFIAWNTKRPNLADARVRRALTLAVNREAIVDAYFGPKSKVGGPYVISSFWASNEEIEPLPYDPKAAEKLLQEAGYRKGADGVYANEKGRLSIGLGHQTNHVVRASICERVRSDLEKIGVEIRLQPEEYGALGNRVLGKHDYDAAFLGANTASKVDMKPMFHSSSIDLARNCMGYKNVDVDRWIEEARTTLDTKRAKDLWGKAQKQLHEDQPLMLIYEEHGYAAINKRVQNVRVTSLSAYDNLHEWSVADAESSP